MMLVRRGYRTAVAARDFLSASETHDPFEFDAMEEVVEGLLAAAGAGSRSPSTVTTTSTGSARPRSWSRPCASSAPNATGSSRTASTTVTGSPRTRPPPGRRRHPAAPHRRLRGRLPGRGRLARELGVEVIVTDHHEPGERLPECPILHPRLSGYPFEDLCATAVAYKLASALRERANADAADVSDLDLVALATVADLVPLRGENRTLVREGSPRPPRAADGLRALIARPGCEIERLDEGDFGFAWRRGQRGRPPRSRRRRGELMLTSDPDRAAEIAEELNRANSERRFAEREASPAPRARCASYRRSPRGAAVVIAGEGWHPGVVGIVASRMVEAHWRPAIVIGLDERRARPRLGPEHPRLRPARRTRGLRRAPRALRRAPRRRRDRDPRGERRRLSRRLRRARRVGAHPGGPGSLPARRRDRRRREPRLAGRRRARAPGPVRKGEPRAPAARPRGARPRRAADGRGGPPRSFQPAERGAPRARGCLRRERGPRPRRRGRAARRRREARAEPLERRRRAAGDPLGALQAGARGGRGRAGRGAGAGLLHRRRRGRVVAAIRRRDGRRPGRGAAASSGPVGPHCGRPHG